MNARFVELEAAGWSAARIAAELGVSSRTVQRWRAAAELSHQSWPEHAPADRERAARLLADGCSVQEVARSVGAAWPTIVRWLPDAPRWSKSEAGQFAAAVRRAA